VAAATSASPGKSRSDNETAPADSSRRLNPTLPPEGTPWALSKRSLFARALRGDKVAAERLFRDTQTCGKTLTLQNELDSLASAWPPPIPEKKKEEIQRSEKHLREMLAGVENMCTEGDKAELARDVDQILLAAARAGNKTAAACYLDRRFHDILRSPHMWGGDISGSLSEVESERYEQFAQQFADAAVKDGNWSVVAWMGFAYAPSKKYGLAAQVFSTDPVKEYAYVRLQELGATAELKAKKSARLSVLRASGSISDADLQRSEAWAQSTFEKYFHEPLETDQPPACFEPGA
jgi:hypothetical protein